MKAPVATALLLGALVGPWAVLFGLNASMADHPVSTEAFEPDRCTRACSGFPTAPIPELAADIVRHQRAGALRTGSCRHAAQAALPASLTGDQGLYGDVIRGLFAGQRGSGGRIVYGTANIVLFVLVWPGTMLALLALGLAQRVRITRLREAQRA